MSDLDKWVVRADRGRPRTDKEDLVPRGVAAMTDDEFWGRVRLESATRDAAAIDGQSGTVSGTVRIPGRTHA